MAKENDKISIFPKKTDKKNSLLKIIGVFVVVLAVLSLVFSSFLSGVGRRGGNNNFGQFGHREIEYQANNIFGRSLENELSKYDSNSSGQSISDFTRYLAWREAFSVAVFTASLDYFLSESGYTPSPKLLDRNIVQFGPYRTNGEFDEIKYINSTNQQKKQVRDQMREQLIIQTWSEDNLISVHRSSQLLSFLEDMRSNTANYDFISLPFSDYPQESVLEYADANSKLFSELSLSRITVEDEKEAVKLFHQLSESSDSELFYSTATEKSVDSYAGEGGRMGYTRYYVLSELVGDKNVDIVFSNGKDELSGPFETDFGWVFFRNDSEVRNAEINSDIVDDVRSFMLTNETGLIEDAMVARAEELRTLALREGNFRRVMEENSLEILLTPTFPVNYGGDSLLGNGPESSGEEILANTSSSDEFWSGITPLERVGDISQPVVLNNSVALFSLANRETREKTDRWDSLVKYEFSRTRESDFNRIISENKSGLLVDNFSTTYRKNFPESSL